VTHFTEAILAAGKARAAPLCAYNKQRVGAVGGQKRPAHRVGRIGAARHRIWVALRRLPDASIAPGHPLRTAPTRATRSAPMK